MNARAAIVIGCVYIVAGLGGMASHLLPLRGVDWSDLFWPVVVCLAAIVAGVFLLLRQSWARWLALAWMGFHVVLSAFHSVAQTAIHAVFFLIIAYFLFFFRRPAGGVGIPSRSRVSGG